jgi:phage N-6-adenine-methyltransferase
MRCADFYKKWKRNPNWCHKCESAVSEIESYIDLVDGMEKRGLPSEIAYAKLPENVARPLISIQDEEIKENAIQHVENLLKRETPTGGAYTEKITKGDVEQIIQKVSNVHFTSETDEWYTPKEIVDSVLEVLGEIDLDPCSNSKTQPTIPARKHFTKEEDGLTKSWEGTVYMNPPYGREIKDWISKLLEEWEAGKIEGIALVPARTDTDWFHQLDSHPWCAVRGRLKFSSSPNSAPFPSAVFYLGQDEDIEGIERFVKTFRKHGTIFQRM